MPKLDKSQPLTFLSPLFKEHRGIDKGGDKAVMTRNMNEITTVASVFSALLPPSRALNKAADLHGCSRQNSLIML